jgi:GAF domain-containing protein
MVDDADEREFERLRALHETGILDAAAPEFEEVVKRAKEQFDVPIALVTLIDRTVQILKARIGLDVESTPRAWAFCDYTIRTNDVFVVPDAHLDSRFASNPLVTGPPFIRFYAGAPLTYLEDVRLGALCLIAPTPRDFSLGDRAELAALADEITALIAQREFRDLKL